MAQLVTTSLPRVGIDIQGWMPDCGNCDGGRRYYVPTQEKYTVIALGFLLLICLFLLTLNIIKKRIVRNIMKSRGMLDDTGGVPEAKAYDPWQPDLERNSVGTSGKDGAVEEVFDIDDVSGGAVTMGLRQSQPADDDDDDEEFSEIDEEEKFELQRALTDSQRKSYLGFTPSAVDRPEDEPEYGSPESPWVNEYGPRLSILMPPPERPYRCKPPSIHAMELRRCEKAGRRSNRSTVSARRSKERASGRASFVGRMATLPSKP